MKIEFTSLESEPLIYFLLHSGAFVAGLGIVFFLLGMWFGALTWGRHRRQNQRLREEAERLREEMAGLKRKLAEQIVRPATGPLHTPPPALLTEVLPSVTDIFPDRSAPSVQSVTQSLEAGLAIPSLPFLPDTPTPPEPPLMPMPALFEIRHMPEVPTVKAQPSSHPSPPPPQPEPADDDDFEPFSFLMDDPLEETDTAAQDEEPAPEAPASALGAIIAPDAHGRSAPVAVPPSVIPETDPALGLIFKERPGDADDLTRLQGISPALQNRLQELGVYRFQQIAGWSSAQVREFSRRLAFKDRIERERWVEQARRMV